MLNAESTESGGCGYSQPPQCYLANCSGIWCCCHCVRRSCFRHSRLSSITRCVYHFIICRSSICNYLTNDKQTDKKQSHNRNTAFLLPAPLKSFTFLLFILQPLLLTKSFCRQRFFPWQKSWVLHA